MISITANGKPRTLEGETPLPEFLRSLNVDPRLVAVAVNGEVVPRNQHGEVVLRDGDEVEVVRMVGGGSVQAMIGQAKEVICKVVCPDIPSVGSGFFVTRDVVVTCDHVISYEVPTPEGLIRRELSGNIMLETQQGAFPARVISSENSTDPYFYDYSLLRVEAHHPAWLPLGDYGSVAVGDDILILGFPLGSGHLVATRAMVAAKPRVPSHRNQIVTLNVVELDGSINVGNSGGPAIRADTGEAVGIVSVRYGSVRVLIDAYRERMGPSAPDWLTALLDILEEGDRFMNPGLGHAVSVEYVRGELERLGVQ